MPFSIMAHDLATGEDRELYTGGDSWCSLVVTPDGQEMFFYDDRQTTIKVISTAGGEPRVIDERRTVVGNRMFYYNTERRHSSIGYMSSLEYITRM